MFYYYTIVQISCSVCTDCIENNIIFDIFTSSSGTHDILYLTFKAEKNSATVGK